MQKKKVKDKKMQNRLTLWLSVLFLGLLVGVSIQFTRAWVEPSADAPDGNIAAPINTGASRQVKKGTLSNPADICVDKTGDGDEKCLGDLVTFPDCSLSGGVPISVGALTICKFAGSSCPTNVEIREGTVINWTQYLNYSETMAQTCTGTGTCASTVTSGYHPFGNIDPATEALESKEYLSGEKEWMIVSCPNNTCTSYSCWNFGGPICCGYYCGPGDEVWGWGDCETTPSTCAPTKSAVGCIIE